MAQSAPANRVASFDVTVAAGVASTAPTETATTFRPGHLVGLELDIPDGHEGLTGIYFALAHGRAIPETDNAWITGNDEHISWSLAGFLNTGAWSVFTYNRDGFPHTFHIRYLINDQDLFTVQAGSVVAPTPLLV